MVSLVPSHFQAFEIIVVFTAAILILKFIEKSENRYSDIQTIDNHEPVVILAVISARENFRQRESIRRSWGGAVKDFKHLMLKFFVGKECAIPLVDRKDEYSCHEANINKDLHPSTSTRLRGKLHCEKLSPSLFNKPCYSGFGFRINHPLKLSYIGVQYELLLKNINLQVVFRDPEEVLDTIVFHGSSCDTILNSFCFIKLENSFLLPNKFEGELFLKFNGEIKSTLEQTCIWENDDFVHFTFGRIENGVEKYDGKMCSYIIANFTISDNEYLNNHIAGKLKRKLEWTKELGKNEQNLQLEIEKHRDIVVLPNITDVYRNLPQKCMKAFQWSHENYPNSAVLKLDDDVHVNIKFLLELVASEWFKTDTIAIWSHFYYNRGVPLFGKWADFEFRGFSYPPFPSGSGYLVSKRLVEVLSSNAPFLRSFQGEDISVGIWTEALGHEGETVKKNNVRCWLDSSSCEESFIIPELTIEHIMQKSAVP